MLGGIQAFGRREIFDLDAFLKIEYHGDLEHTEKNDGQRCSAATLINRDLL